MCGIAGSVGIKIDRDTVNSTLAKISHRGPDSSGTWQDASQGIWLAHTRLSVLDLTNASSQPMTDRTGRYVITYNGEIYNYKELRRSLEKQGCGFQTSSDSEVLLQGLITQGLEFLKRCNGMWAFFLWDKERATGYMARDRFGVKPLYYSMNSLNNSLCFASEMKALFPMMRNKRLVENYLEFIDNPFLYESTEFCLYEGIKRLPAGFCATYRGGKLAVERWWDTLDHITLNKDEYRNQCNDWAELFKESVNIRLIGDVPIGVALSGGLDSSSVLATISEINPASPMVWKNEKLNAYCSSFPGCSNDETKWARVMANSTNTDLTAICIESSDLKKDLMNDLAMVEDPYLTIPTPMIKTYQAIRKNGIKVSIDGHGADELFSGYGHLLQALRCTNKIKELAEIIEIDNSTRTGIYSERERLRLGEIARAKLTRLARSAIKGIKINTTHYVTPSNSGFRSALNEQIYSLRKDPRYRQLDVFTQSMYEIFHLSFLPTLLRNYDRYSMANGVEARMPFLDWRLVCFTFGLPWTSKLGGTYTKRILRDAMKDYLPEEVRLRRDKIGWNAPLNDWFGSHEMKSFLEEIISSCHDSRVRKRAHLAVKRFYSGSHQSFLDGEILWHSIQPAMWLEAQQL